MTPVRNWWGQYTSTSFAGLQLLTKRCFLLPCTASSPCKLSLHSRLCVVTDLQRGRTVACCAYRAKNGRATAFASVLLPCSTIIRVRN